MLDHFQFNDDAFLMMFENASFDPKWFNHEAHLRLAYLLIDRYGIEIAQEKICSQILNYATKLGVQDTFNKTITIASTKAVYHFKLKSESENFKDLISEFPRLKFQFKALLAKHYQIDIYNSEKAKQSFLQPDLLPFD